MKIANGKDFWAGVMFVAFGLSFWVIASPPKLLVDLLGAAFGVQAWGYSMGTAVRMGPAYFPTALGGMLVVLGAVVLFRAFVSKIHHPLAVLPFRFWLILGGLVLGVIAYHSQTLRTYGIPGQVAHLVLAGVSIGLIFAAFGERSLWIVLFAVVMFGYLLKPLGLVLAVFILTIVSALPGFTWTRKDFQFLPVYAAVGVLLVYLTLLVSPWFASALVVVLGAVGINFPHVLALVLAEIGLSGVLAFYASRPKWPQVTAGHVVLLSFLLGVFAVASFVHGLGLPINIWPSIWE